MEKEITKFNPENELEHYCELLKFEFYDFCLKELAERIKYANFRKNRRMANS